MKTQIKSFEFDEIRELIQELHEPEILDLTDKELIFTLGDVGKKAYLILEGKVLLLLPEESSSKFSNVILNKGLFFGEKSLVSQRTVSTSAIAYGRVKLLAIPEKKLVENYKKNPQLRQLFNTFKIIYSIPKRGTVEQYLGFEEGRGKTSNYVYTIEEGTIHSTYFLDHHLLTMKLSEGKKYRFQDEDNYAEIEIKNHRLVALKIQGFQDKIPGLCRALIYQSPIENEHIDRFLHAGTLGLPHILSEEEASEIICECASVTRGELQLSCDQGINSFEGLKSATGACLQCRECAPKIFNLLGINPWIQATLQTSVHHSDTLRSFFIKPKKGHFNPFSPGQYVLIQVKINNKIYHRPYSISDVLKDGGVRVTVKKEEGGIVSDWLFHLNDTLAEINVTQPEGEFRLNLDQNVAALCFAEGMGITPFICFVKTADKNKSHQRIHIHYSESKKKNFVFAEEFNKIKLPSFSITHSEKSIKEHEIEQVVHLFLNPEIYICGSEKFVNFVSSILVNKGYNPSKIHYEKYVYVPFNK